MRGNGSKKSHPRQTDSPFALPSRALFSAASPARFPRSACCFRRNRIRPARQTSRVAGKFAEHRRAASELKDSTSLPARVRHQIDVEPSCSPCRSDARPLIRNPSAQKTTRTMPGFLHAGVCRLCRQQNHRAAKRAARATRLTHAQKMHKKRAANLGLQLSLS